MNDLQKLGNNLIKAFKPLNDAINQICGIAQRPVFQIPPDLFKDVNFKGFASMGAFSDRIIKAAPLASTSLKMSGVWEPTQHDINPETTLAELRPGAVFVTNDNVYAVKSEYRTGDNSQCECILLESGEYAWFKDRDKTIVHQVSVEWYLPKD